MLNGRAAPLPEKIAAETAPHGIHELFLAAQRHLQAKRAEEALPPLRDILERVPNQPDALNLTSVAFGQLGLADEAVRYSRQAIALRPDDAGFRLNLANRLNDRREIDEAVAEYQKALELAPDHVGTLKSYMRCLAGASRWTDALPIAERLRALVDGDADLLVECANICIGAEDRRQAQTLYQQALVIRPNEIDWLLQLARIAINLSDINLAREVGERVLTLTDNVEMHAMLASIMHETGDLDAMEKHLKAIPDGTDQTGNAANLMGMMLASQTRVKDGLAAMARTELAAADIFPLQATRMMYLNYDPEMPKAALQQAHRDVWRNFRDAVPKLDQAELGRPRDPERRLRVGLVSPDFRAHSVAYFIRPYLDAFDRDRFDVVVYSSTARPDGVTADLRSLPSEWVDVFDINDRLLAERIRRDRIDILIDLAGLTRDNRLLAFTGRPAPIQMTYIGYPNTTGCPDMDYRITDWIADPEGEDDDYVETLIRLPGCFLCYATPRHAPPIEPGPVGRGEGITFGSFNNFAKINPELLSLWSDVLNAVPDSSLLFKSTTSSDPTAQREIRGHLAAGGVHPERVRFSSFRPTPGGHLAVYNEIDIALDTFPYNGTTTTCEALWMGAPVITLKGDRHAGRVGASLLSAIGFEAGIADSHDDYVLTARLLAENPNLLKTMRRSLRDAVYHSPLCDNQAHARTLEEAFRAVWHMWCDDHGE